jgi:flagellar protein FliL
VNELAKLTDDEVAEAEETAPAVAPPKASRKKMAMIAIAGLVVIGGGGFAGVKLFGGGHKAGAPAAVSDGAPIYVEVPAMTINLRSPDGQARFLKVRFTLVAGSASAEQIEAKLPMVLDAFQPFLRELRPEDLAGSAAVYRLKEELAVRLASVVGAGAVRDILIQDLVQQ